MNSSCRCECHDPALHMGWGGAGRHCNNCRPLSQSPKDSTHCVFITKSLSQKNEIVRYLIALGYDAKGDRLLLGEYGVHVTFPWEGGTVPYARLEGITAQIEAFVAELPALTSGEPFSEMLTEVREVTPSTALRQKAVSPLDNGDRTAAFIKQHFGSSED